jgi:chromosome partitioning protein
MKKIFSFINHKGGVGKTTSAVNVGAGLSLMGKKILLIDLDPQANLTYNTGMSPNEAKNIYGALRGKYPLPVVQTSCGLDVVCSTIDLSVAELELIGEPGREFILKSLIMPVQSSFDFIFIDCPPALGLLTLNALSASQACIIPVELSNFALVGMAKLFDVIKKTRERINPDLDSYNVLITRTDKRQAIHKELAAYLANEFQGNIFNAEIRHNVKILESQVQRMDIFSYDKSSNGANDYLALCKEFLNTYETVIARH